MTPDGQTPNVIILGCVSMKHRGPAPAKDLYASPLWAKRRRYAERSGVPWVIFSAKHGILDPYQTIEWYDVALKTLPADVRARKGDEAVLQLAKRFGPLRGKTFEIHAGDAYVSALRRPLEGLGAGLTNPLLGLRFGYQLQWYGPAKVPGSSASRSGLPPLPRRSVARRCPPFTLQFDRSRVPDFARRYQYGGDGRMADIGTAARAQGFFTRPQLVEMCRWKTPRSGPLVAANTTADVETATRLALSARDERTRMGALLKLQGVSFPTASVLLHFADSDRYPILDVRALEALGCRKKGYSMGFWLDYVEATRELARDIGSDMRTLDRALWQWSKEREGKNEHL